MKHLPTLLLVLSLGLLSQVWAQETPTFTHTWTEEDGTVAIPALDLPRFGETEARIEVTWTPGAVYTPTDPQHSQRLLSIPNHLAIWAHDNGIHGYWYNDTGERRVFRTRWGLPVPGIPIKIVIAWATDGYVVIVDNVVRIHDWQTTPTIVYPDPNIVDGHYGSRASGGDPTTGSFTISLFDSSGTYDRCSADVVGTINESVPLDNSGSWSQGIDPSCGNPAPSIGAATLSWTIPTRNGDGTPLTDLAGFKIYYGLAQSGPYPVERDISNPATTTYVIENLAVGTWYFVATAYNTAGGRSGFSNEVNKDITAPPPGPPPVPEPPVLTVVGTTVYSVSKTNDAFLLAAVGTIPPGTGCDENQYVRGVNEDDKRHVVPVAEVDRWFGSVRSKVVVADCE